MSKFCVFQIFLYSSVLEEDSNPYLWNFLEIFEPRHAKTFLLGFATRKDSNQPAQLSLETLAIASIYIILSKQRTTKVLIRLRGCPGSFFLC